jgi:hypothetical protein
MPPLLLVALLSAGFYYALLLFLGIPRGRDLKPAEIKEGDILLQRPLYHLHWCVEHGVWPGWRIVFQGLFAILVWPILKSHATHVLQCTQVLDSGALVVVHTQTGRVRRQTTTSLPRGFLETCVVVPTHEQWEQVAGGGQRIRHVFDNLQGRALNPIWLLMTPVIRKTHWCSTIYDLHDKRFKIHNCTHLIALAWRECGVRLIDSTGLPEQGLYPDDFRAHVQVKELVEEAKRADLLTPGIRYRNGEIHPDNVEGIVGLD